MTEAFTNDQYGCMKCTVPINFDGPIGKSSKLNLIDNNRVTYYNTMKVMNLKLGNKFEIRILRPIRRMFQDPLYNVATAAAELWSIYPEEKAKKNPKSEFLIYCNILITFKLKMEAEATMLWAKFITRIQNNSSYRCQQEISPEMKEVQERLYNIYRGRITG